MGSKTDKARLLRSLGDTTRGPGRGAEGKAAGITKPDSGMLAQLGTIGMGRQGNPLFP